MTTTVAASLPFGVNFARFLGSQDRVFVAGQTAQAEYQILFNTESADASGLPVPALSPSRPPKFTQVAHESIPHQQLTCCELCSVPRLGKTFVVTATTDVGANARGQSTVRLVETETAEREARLTLHDFVPSVQSATPVSALSFNPDVELLALGNHGGEVSIIDIAAGRELLRFVADPCGVTDLTFLTSGQLTSTGLSHGGSCVKLWDIRALVAATISASHTPSIARAALQLRHKVKNDSDVPRGYTSLLGHPLQEKILCGREDGVVSSWDLRANHEAAAHFRIHSRDTRVTALCVHPLKYDILLSGGDNGSIFATNLDAASKAGYPLEARRYSAATGNREWETLLGGPECHLEDTNDVVDFSKLDDESDYLSKPVLVSDESVTRSGAVTSLDCLHSGLFDPSNGKLADPAMLAGYALGGLQWHRLSQSDFEFDTGNDMGMMIGGTLDPQLLYLEDDRAIAEGDDNAEQ